MSMDRAMVSAVSVNIACRIHDALLPPRAIRPGEKAEFLVEGLLPLKGVVSRCKFRINSSWTEKPPAATCDEPWVRTGDDWHVGRQNHAMCYIYRRQWLGLTQRVVNNRGALAIIPFAHLWILRNCQWLLNKHLVAEQLGLDSWQDSWGYWPHGEVEARKEYEKRIKRGGTNGRAREEHADTLV